MHCNVIYCTVLTSITGFLLRHKCCHPLSVQFPSKLSNFLSQMLPSPKTTMLPCSDSNNYSLYWENIDTELCAGTFFAHWPIVQYPRHCPTPVNKPCPTSSTHPPLLYQNVIFLASRSVGTLALHYPVCLYVCMYVSAQIFKASHWSKS